jgi:hypothetical protein
LSIRVAADAISPRRWVESPLSITNEAGFSLTNTELPNKPAAKIAPDLYEE